MLAQGRGEMFTEFVVPAGCDRNSLVRYQQVTDAITQLNIVRKILFSNNISSRKLDDAYFPRLGLRTYHITYDEPGIFSVHSVKASRVVSDSPPLNGADPSEQLEEHHYYVIGNTQGFALRRAHWNDENAPFSPQLLLESPERLGNATKAFIHSSNAAAQFAIKHS